MTHGASMAWLDRRLAASPRHFPGARSSRCLHHPRELRFPSAAESGYLPFPGGFTNEIFDPDHLLGARAIPILWHSPAAAGSQQDTMSTCNATASANVLTGDARASFMSACLQAK
jgi:hypothetical protein